jgi:hypothetical protein
LCLPNGTKNAKQEIVVVENENDKKKEMRHGEKNNDDRIVRDLWARNRIDDGRQRT